MDLTIHYSTTKNKLKLFLKEERILLPPKFIWSLFEFLGKICNYEEEENKIRPCLLLGYNLNEAIREVPNSYFYRITKGQRNGSDLEKRLKAIVPFCNNGWNVVINIQSSFIEYGISRAFTGPRGLNLTEVIFEIDENELQEVDYGLIEVCAISKYEISFKGLRKNSLIIDYRFFESYHSQCNYEFLADDLTSGINNQADRQILHDIFKKLMPVAARRVHGTIVLIVKNQYRIEKNLHDGIWLTDPIDLFLPALASEDNACSGQIFYGTTGLFIDMMNVDGITVIDNLGKIRGYNIFINKEVKTKKIINGGARKRAAYNLLHLENPYHLGVYFLSQDGDSFYERKY